jgi:hypothetical protein
MLSRLLRLHPDVLSLSEFFGIARLASGGGPKGVPAGDLTGAQLWRLLASTFPPLDAMIAAGLRTSEMAYPGGRFTTDTGIPLVSQYMLPVLRPEDPDGLFDLLAAEIPTWPQRPAAEQYLALFGYLAELLDRPVVVERSASSLQLIPVLHRLFPQARFVHLYRNGPDCALSMSKHPAFRREILALGAMRSTGLPPGTPLHEVDAALPERLRGMISPPFNAARLREYPIPVEVFARDRWSAMIQVGAAALRELPRGSWTGMRYEDLLRDPGASLRGFAEFAGMDAREDWLEQASDAIDPSRVGAAEAELDPAALERVRAACEPGVRALAVATGRRA